MRRDQASLRCVAIVLLVVVLCSIGSASSFTAVTSSTFGVKASLVVAPTRRTCVASTPLYVSDEQETPAAAVEEPSTSGEQEGLSTETTSEASLSKRKVQRERYTLFVGNLPFETSDQELKSLFEQCGSVRLMTVPKKPDTGKARGFAFIDMSTPEECQACIDALDGTTFKSRVIKVNISVPKDSVVPAARPKTEELAAGCKKLYMGNIPFDATEEEVKTFYERFGEVKEVFIPMSSEGTGRGFAFVTMSEEDADRAIEATDGAEFGGRILVVNEPLPPGKKATRRRRPGSTKLFVGNLSFYTVAETLEDLFGEFGQIYDCYLPQDQVNGSSRGFGFVSMAKQDAMRAMEELNGCEVDGRTIQVNEARSKGIRNTQRDEYDDGYDSVTDDENA